MSAAIVLPADIARHNPTGKLQYHVFIPEPSQFNNNQGWKSMVKGRLMRYREVITNGCSSVSNLR
jgi:hypothetical protein